MVEIKRILVAVDGSEHAARAVDYAAFLAGRLAAKLVILHVMTEIGSDRAADELRGYADLENVRITDRELLGAAAQNLVDRAAERARETAKPDIETAVEVGSPARAIVDHARSGDVDLIVLGRRGFGDLAGLLMGSVSHKVGHLAHCPCLTVE